ncbi:MAG: DUF2911 domain-containing protein [Saprospiraceae bacterium]
MKAIQITLLAGLIVCFFACGTSTTSQQAETSPKSIASTLPPAYSTEVVEAKLASPRKEMKTQLDEVSVTINYGSPAVKDRARWGGLVPWNEVWRTGANEATRITFDKDAQINGQPIAAGTYALFTLPKQSSWEIIFNTISDQWGAYDYDPAKDVLRVTATPQTVESMAETMDFMVEDGQVILIWEHLRLPFSVTQNSK